MSEYTDDFELVDGLLRVVAGDTSKERAALRRLKEEVERLTTLIDSQGREHTQPCSLGSLCPWCEIERLRQDIEQQDARTAAWEKERLNLSERLAAAENLLEARTELLTCIERDDEAIEMLIRRAVEFWERDTLKAEVGSAYDAGYANGESSMWADYAIALDCDIDDCGPSAVASRLAAAEKVCEEQFTDGDVLIVWNDVHYHVLYFGHVMPNDGHGWHKVASADTIEEALSKAAEWEQTRKGESE